MTSVRQRLPRWLIGLALFVLAVLMLAPLVWMVTESFVDESHALRLPPKWIPRPFSVDNYRTVTDLIPFGRMALNSLIVATIATAGSMLVSVLAAYAFSRLRFPGRDVIFVVMLAALMIPGQMTVIPVFVLFRNLHLIDRLPALWLPALINVFAIFFFRQYFNTIPRELDEAAKIDGANNLWILFRVILPLSGPALAAVAILTFEASWNSYFWPLIFIRSEENMTLPLGLVALELRPRRFVHRRVRSHHGDRHARPRRVPRLPEGVRAQHRVRGHTWLARPSRRPRRTPASDRSASGGSGQHRRWQHVAWPGNAVPVTH